MPVGGNAGKRRTDVPSTFDIEGTFDRSAKPNVSVSHMSANRLFLFHNSSFALLSQQLKITCAFEPTVRRNRRGSSTGKVPRGDRDVSP